VLNRIALSRVAIKGRDHKLLRKFISQYVLREGIIGSISGDGPESAVMWHTRFFESLSYELVEILDTDELLDLPPRIFRSILHAGMRQTQSVIELL